MRREDQKEPKKHKKEETPEPPEENDCNTNSKMKRKKGGKTMGVDATAFLSLNQILLLML
jgi:hypothetical protein